MIYLRPSDIEEQIGKEIVDAAYNIHKELGPGLLEKVYEICMEYEMNKRGLKVQRQVIIPIEYDDQILKEGLKLDLLVNERVIVELKAIEKHNQVWDAQIISHLKLTHLNLGYLINFNVPTIKQGIKRFRN